MPLFFLQSDTQFFLILAVTFIVFSVFIFGLCAAVYFYIKSAERRAGKIWAETARQLGLQMKPADDSMLSDFDKLRNRMGANASPLQISTAQTLYGNFANRPVEITNRQIVSSHYSLIDSSSPVQKKTYMTWCEARFANRKNLEFEIKSANGGNFISRAISGGGDLQIGFPPFDQNFKARGADLQRIYQMLCADSFDNRLVAEQFVACFRNDWIIEATSQKVVVKLPAMVLEAASLAPALQAATYLARGLETVLAK